MQLEGERVEKCGGSTCGAEVLGLQHLERRERTADCAEGTRSIQDASPGTHLSDTWRQCRSVDQVIGSVSDRLARLLWLLPNSTSALDSGRVDSPETTYVYLAAVEERAEPLQGTAPTRRAQAPRSGRRGFPDRVLADVRAPGGSPSTAKSLFRLDRPSPSSRVFQRLTRSNRRGT